MKVGFEKELRFDWPELRKITFVQDSRIFSETEYASVIGGIQYIFVLLDLPSHIQQPRWRWFLLVTSVQQNNWSIFRKIVRSTKLIRLSILVYSWVRWRPISEPSVIYGWIHSDFQDQFSAVFTLSCPDTKASENLCFTLGIELEMFASILNLGTKFRIMMGNVIGKVSDTALVDFLFYVLKDGSFNAY